MANRRKEDGAKYRNWFRSDRMFEDAGNWFFFTREGSIEGPFRSRGDAKIGLGTFLVALGIDLNPAEKPAAAGWVNAR